MQSRRRVIVQCMRLVVVMFCVILKKKYVFYDGNLNVNPFLYLFSSILTLKGSENVNIWRHIWLNKSPSCVKLLLIIFIFPSMATISTKSRRGLSACCNQYEYHNLRVHFTDYLFVLRDGQIDRQTHHHDTADEGRPNRGGQHPSKRLYSFSVVQCQNCQRYCHSLWLIVIG